MFPGVHAKTDPAKPAVVIAETGRTLTYQELDQRSSSIAVALHALGARRGDVIALLSDNVPEVFEIYWAAIRSGLYITAVNWHLAADEAAYIVNDCGARVLFASAGVGELAAEIVSQTPGVEHRFAFGGHVEGHRAYSEVIVPGHGGLADQPRGAEMLYSSGTTGRPKGVKPVLLDLQVDEPGEPLVAMMAHGFGITGDDRYLSPAPIYHAAPLKWCGGIHALGGTVVLMERFDAANALAAIEKYRITVTQMVPTMLIRMLQLAPEQRAGADLSSLRLAVHAAAPCPPDVKQAMIDWWGPKLVEYYGATEGHGVTVVTSQEWVTKRGTVGRAALGVPHICDDKGIELSAGQIGTIYFERDQAPFEYHNDPEKTAAARHPGHDNWSTVGDMGYLDDDGFLYLTDRKAFMIISGGVNIYPQEIENVLALHPKVCDVAVIGVPDAEMGEQVKAIVQLRDPGQAGDEVAAELITYVRDRIAHYKAPKSVDFIDELPRLATGKLAKRKLLDNYMEVNR